MQVSKPRPQRNHLNVVNTVCARVRKWERREQTRPVMSDTKRCLLNAPRVPVPKVHRGPGQEPTRDDSHSDRMITRAHFDKIQELIPHQFTLDACANRSGDNSLCTRYCLQNMTVSCSGTYKMSSSG